MHASSPSSLSSVLRLKNIRAFLAFRVFFNARFYYPVFTILFLDFGLSVEQFALLNTVWAATIVLVELPSGALADLMGRRQLLIATATLMIVEMALIAFVPLGYGKLIFWVFLVNRIISGLAEAMASGSDEALAYDTLVEQGLSKEWPRVLDLQMRAQNIGFMVAMTIGGLVYDHGLLNRILIFFGGEAWITPAMSMRYPIYLTLLFALCALAATLSMRDPLLGQQAAADTASKTKKGLNLRALLQLTLQAGGWIIRTPFALAIILFAMTLDHTLRMVVTLTSQYYRLIDLPESIFGLLGSLVAILGLFVPKLALWMIGKFSAGINALLLSTTMLVVLGLITFFIPGFGVLPMLAVFLGMMLTSFFTSHYLNAITSSEQRATVLSFKGLAFNAAYGLIGMGFALLMRHERMLTAANNKGLGDVAVEHEAFKAAVSWFPWYLAAALGLAALICLPRLVGRGGVNGISAAISSAKQKE